jgi:hypothetical protein
MLRAIRGPVILITLGVLFALNNFTRFGFSETWPVLLIVLGLLSLLGRQTSPPPYSNPPNAYTPPQAPPGEPPYTGESR